MFQPWNKLQTSNQALFCNGSILNDFEKQVGAICRPWQELFDPIGWSTSTWPSYTRSEQTPHTASPPHTWHWWWCQLQESLRIQKGFHPRRKGEQTIKTGHDVLTVARTHEPQHQSTYHQCPFYHPIRFCTVYLNPWTLEWRFNQQVDGALTL